MRGSRGRGAASSRGSGGRRDHGAGGLRGRPRGAAALGAPPPLQRRDPPLVLHGGPSQTKNSKISRPTVRQARLRHQENAWVAIQCCVTQSDEEELGYLPVVVLDFVRSSIARLCLRDVLAARHAGNESVCVEELTEGADCLRFLACTSSITIVLSGGSRWVCSGHAQRTAGRMSKPCAAHFAIARLSKWDLSHVSSSKAQRGTVAGLLAPCFAASADGTVPALPCVVTGTGYVV